MLNKFIARRYIAQDITKWEFDVYDKMCNV